MIEKFNDIKDTILLIDENVNNEEKRGTTASIISNYNNQKKLIKKVFNETSGENYSKEGILARLIIIDTLYSTNASFCYFTFDHLADAIFYLEDTTHQIKDTRVKTMFANTSTIL